MSVVEGSGTHEGFENITLLNNKVGNSAKIDYETRFVFDDRGQLWSATLTLNGVPFHTGHGRKLAHAKDHAAFQYLFQNGFIVIPPR